MNRVKNTVVVIGLLTSVPVLAAEEKMADKPGVPSLGQIMGASGINVSGYIDTAYSYLSGTSNFTSDGSTSNGFYSRVYDRERNSFNLHMLDLTVSKLPTEGFGGLVTLNAGMDANVNASLGTGSSDEFDIQAGYVHYASGPFMAIAGKFATLAGTEVIKSPYNMNYSRSWLFGYGPFTHTGARMTYAVNDKMSLIAGINNGWDRFKASADSNESKTIELSASTTPIKSLTAALTYYGGKETGLAGVTGMRHFGDLVVNFSATDALTLALNSAYGTQKDAIAIGEKAKWWGTAVYANLKFADQWRVAARYEHFDDKDGFRTGVMQKLDSGTLTLAYMPTEHAELRGEVRGDWSNKDAFLNNDGAGKDTQNSVALQAIYKF